MGTMRWGDLETEGLREGNGDKVTELKVMN